MAGDRPRHLRFDLRHESKHAWGELVVGYWYRSKEAPPPTAQRLHRINSDGNLRFDRWTTLTTTTRHACQVRCHALTAAAGPLGGTDALPIDSNAKPTFSDPLVYKWVAFSELHLYRLNDFFHC